MKKIFKKFLKLFFIVIIIALCIIGYLYYSSLPMEVQTETIVPTQLTDSFKENGVVKKGNDINITSKVNGKITKVLVRKNTYVKKGAVIATLDTKDYLYEKSQHENNIKSYQAEINKTKEDESYDKKEITYSIQDLKIQLDRIKNNKNKNNIEETMDASPEAYIEALKVNVDICENELKLTENNYFSQKKLYENGVISKNDFDSIEKEYTSSVLNLKNAQTKYLDAKKRLENLVAQKLNNENINLSFYNSTDMSFDNEIKSLETQIASLEAKLGNDYSTSANRQTLAMMANENLLIKQLNDKIADCSIKAENDGLIIDLPVENLSNVSEGDVIAVIKNENRFTVEVDVLTSAEPYLKLGDKVKLNHKLKSGTNTYEGTISEIYNYAVKTTSALGLDEYRIKIVVEVDKNSPLKDGYEVEAEFFIYKSDNILTVPNSSLFKKEDKNYVFKVQDGVAVAIPIEIGYKAGNRTEVKSGLAENDEIVFNANTENLTEGIKIVGMSAEEISANS